MPVILSALRKCFPAVRIIVALKAPQNEAQGKSRAVCGTLPWVEVFKMFTGPEGAEPVAQASRLRVHRASRPVCVPTLPSDHPRGGGTPPQPAGETPALQGVNG